MCGTNGEGTETDGAVMVEAFLVRVKVSRLSSKKEDLSGKIVILRLSGSRRSNRGVLSLSYGRSDRQAIATSIALI